jgi:single-strand DNA-binding protein
MASYNRVVLVGNLTRDPDYRQLSSGQAVCKVGLATNRQYKNRQTGAVIQEVCYIDVDVWGAQAESCRQYLQKGRSVLIEGRLKLDSWEDQNGQSRSKHTIVADRVVFLGSGAPASENVEMDSVETSRGATLSDAAGISSQEQQKTEAQLLSQISQIKKRSAIKKSPEASESADFTFQDQPPFEDELPF